MKIFVLCGYLFVVRVSTKEYLKFSRFELQKNMLIIQGKFGIACLHFKEEEKYLLLTDQIRPAVVAKQSKALSQIQVESKP